MPTRKLFLDAHPDAVVVADAGGTIRLVNARAEQLFGYRRTELIGQSIDLLVADEARKAHPSNRGRFHAEPISRPMGVGSAQLGRRRDGGQFAVGISLSPISTEKGTYVAATIRDMSDDRAVEAYAASRREAAEQNTLPRRRAEV